MDQMRAVREIASTRGEQRAGTWLALRRPMLRSRPWVIAGVLVGVAAMMASGDAMAKKKKKAAPAAAAAPAPKAPVQVAAAVPAAKEEASPDFDRTAASSAIVGVDLQRCKATNAAKGEGHVTITFTPAGAVQSVVVDKGPWVNTPVAKCMTKEFKKAKVPAFRGEPVTVGKSFKFE
jgi:hypothetical protein